MSQTNRRGPKLLAGVQRQLLATYSVHFAFVVALFCAAVLIPQFFLVRQGLVSADAFRTLYDFAPISWLMAAVVLAIVVAHAFRTAHRVAGPMVQIRRAADLIADGKLDHRITIRKHDYLQAEVDAINEMLDSLASQLGQVSESPREATRVEEPV